MNDNDTNTIKDLPISYSGTMVRARREGRKTQTRRVVKPQPPECAVWVGTSNCPYGKPGDRLVVKEAAWMWCAKVIAGLTKKTGKPKISWCESRNVPPIYCADHPERPTHVPEGRVQKTGDLEYQWHKKNARFLPRWASRGLDEITAIRVERLQDISEADAIAEGIEVIDRKACLFRHYGEPFAQSTDDDPRQGMVFSAQESYATLWESINGPNSWDANPWVWVIEFKVLS